MAATTTTTRPAYRTGTPTKFRPVPKGFRKAIESSDVLKFLASREPEDTERWSPYWQKRHLR